MNTPKPGNYPNTHQKALEINLDGRRYGTFAEIGAGQEVVRWFFRVGGAAGTVAKSMSAYDMTVSDAIYGKSDRYVSRSRLLQMLDHEYSLNAERLSGTGKELFAFADTVAAKSFKGNRDSHGWMGIQYQHTQGAEPSQILIHVRMVDKEAIQQHEALGVTGVNLIHSAFYHGADIQAIIQSLLDDLSPARIYVDAMEFSGPQFTGIDNRLAALYLVQFELSEVAMFGADGKVLQPSEQLYKKAIIIERGTFRPVTNIHESILNSSRAAFLQDYPEHQQDVITIMEMTMQNLLTTSQLDPTDFLARADTLGTIAQPVLITRYPEFHRLVSYLRQFTELPLAFAVGGGMLPHLFSANAYENLDGGILEGLGRLFRKNVRAYVYPQMNERGEIVTADDFEGPAEFAPLYEYLLAQGALKTALEGVFQPSPFTSKEVLRRMHAGDASWEDLIPRPVVDLIKSRGLFGYGKFQE